MDRGNDREVEVKAPAGAWVRTHACESRCSPALRHSIQATASRPDTTAGAAEATHSKGVNAEMKKIIFVFGSEYPDHMSHARHEFFAGPGVVDMPVSKHLELHVAPAVTHHPTQDQLVRDNHEQQK